HALYAVASEETEPGLGWAYAGFLSQVVDNPAMGGDELVQAIVDTYIDDDMRLEDPTYVGNLTRAQAAAAINPDATLTAIDLTEIAPLDAALDDFVDAIKMMDQNVVAQARTYAQAYESIFGDELPSPFIDLGHFVQLIQSSTDDPAVQEAADNLESARQAAIIAEKHGAERPGSTGIAIYFPVRELYSILDNFGYTDIATRFVDTTQWDEFLAFHSGEGGAGQIMRPGSPLLAALQQLLPDLDAEYLQVLADEITSMIDQGLSAQEITQSLMESFDLPEDVGLALADAGLLEAVPVMPPEFPAEPVNNVERKPLQVAPIRLSSKVVYPDEPVSVDTDITGERVGFVYSFIGRYLPEDDVLIIEDQDFLFAEQDTTVGGVTYPQWPEGTFTVGYDWQPIVYAISDGTTSIRTLFVPETYGNSPTYTVDGIYTFADGSADRYARLFFRDGELFQVFGFGDPSANGLGAPREITSQPGDEFTVFEQGYYLADDAEDENYSAPIGTLTFGDERFYIEETPAPSGNYMVGVIAEDLDGNLVESYEDLFVVGEDDVTEEGFVPLVAEDLGFAFLYPDTWLPNDGGGSTDRLILDNADGTAQINISALEYGDASDGSEANLSALDDILAEFTGSADFDNVAVAGDPVDYFMGLYDAQLIDFAFDASGVTYAGEIVASTPAPGLTYAVDFVAPEDEFDSLVPDLDALLYSFSVLVPGIDGMQAGAPQPEYADIAFVDDYADPTSGLYDDETASDWGMGYYDPDREQYVYELNPASGAIYDYYGDAALPDVFMLEVTAQTAGSIDTAYGLIFQVEDDSHFYSFRVSGDGYFLVEKADGDNLETLVEWTVAEPLDLSEEAANTLAVVGADGVYDLYINGIQVSEITDDSYQNGSAGYMVENFDEEAPAAFGFDDFTVGEPAG
ncbi:MAG: clostripain-related cysteine peptidase, partial [Caldilineaceae bacterium]